MQRIFDDIVADYVDVPWSSEKKPLLLANPEQSAIRLLKHETIRNLTPHEVGKMFSEHHLLTAYRHMVE